MLVWFFFRSLSPLQQNNLALSCMTVANPTNLQVTSDNREAILNQVLIYDYVIFMFKKLLNSGRKQVCHSHLMCSVKKALGHTYPLVRLKICCSGHSHSLQFSHLHLVPVDQRLCRSSEPSAIIQDPILTNFSTSWPAQFTSWSS